MAKRANEFASAGRNAVRLQGAAAAAGDETQQSESVEEKPRTREVKWRQGDMEFEAYMRMLDNSVRHHSKKKKTSSIVSFLSFEIFKFKFIFICRCWMWCVGIPKWISVSRAFGAN